MSGTKSGLVWLANILLNVFESAGAGVRESVEAVVKDGRELEKAVAYVDGVLTQGIDLINPGAEDVEKARNIAEAIVWFQKK